MRGPAWQEDGTLSARYWSELRRLLDGAREEERAELIAERLRERKSPGNASEHRPRSVNDRLNPAGAYGEPITRIVSIQLREDARGSGPSLPCSLGVQPAPASQTVAS